MEISAERGIAELVQAKADATQQKIAFGIAAKQLDVQKAQGDAIVNLVEQAVDVQQQLASGHIDIKV